MQNKIEINLTLDETATTLYWDGGAFVNDPCMFTADKETLEPFFYFPHVNPID